MTIHRQCTDYMEEIWWLTLCSRSESLQENHAKMVCTIMDLTGPLSEAGLHGPKNCN